MKDVSSVPDVNLPESLAATEFFTPSKRGFEKELAERMEQIRRWHLRRRQRAEQSAAAPTNNQDTGTRKAPEPDTGDSE